MQSQGNNNYKNLKIINKNSLSSCDIDALIKIILLIILIINILELFSFELKISENALHIKKIVFGTQNLNIVIPL